MWKHRVRTINMKCRVRELYGGLLQVVCLCDRLLDYPQFVSTTIYIGICVDED